MIRPSSSPEVHELANSLGIESKDPAVDIVVHCRQLVDDWVAQAGGIGPEAVSDINALETLIKRHLSLVVEEILTEDDFERLTDKYARGMGEYVFAGLRAKFDDPETPVFGVLIQRRSSVEKDPDRFVAVVDCREELSGEKFARRYFTKWHEIAHRMTTHRYPDDLAYRSDDDDPIETLMDAVASELGFYEPFLGPALRDALANENWLTFEMIESIIQRVFPEASFQATLFACMRLSPTPMVYIELADNPLAIQKTIPNAAAYAHWLQADEQSSNAHDSTQVNIRSTKISCGQIVQPESLFYRVLEGDLLYDEIEHHLCDFKAPENPSYLGRFPCEFRQNSIPNLSKYAHRGVLAHVQVRRVPGKLIGLIQY
ncbi:MAG: hypothetical protein ACK42H_14060 [Planctomycetota bacterium]